MSIKRGYNTTLTAEQLKFEKENRNMTLATMAKHRVQPEPCAFQGAQARDDDRRAAQKPEKVATAPNIKPIINDIIFMRLLPEYRRCQHAF